MTGTRSGIVSIMFVLAGGVVAAGCNASSSSPPALPGAPAPAANRTLEESDLVAFVDSRLYVQNPARGLTVLDVSLPDRPTIAQVTSLTGRGGELYVRGPDVLVVFEEGSTAGRAELVSVRAAATAPVIAARLDLPGRLVRSRLVGDLVVAVSTEPDRAWITTIAVADPARPVIASQRSVTERAVEAFVTNDTVWLAQEHAPSAGTRVRAVSVTSPDGALSERGSILLQGAPRGRHHLDAHGTTFRIVTFSGRAAGSNVFVVDAADLDRLAVLGSEVGIGVGEDLHGTRFDGDRVYVVTYQPGVVFRQSRLVLAGDPLWVVSLQDPRQPRILGLLDVPGWSDWVFPRGDRLVAVGRGEDGNRVAVSLFDVSDPTRPTELRRLEVGDPLASSETATDARGVTIVEANVLGAQPMVVIPLTNPRMINGVYTPDHRVQLMDLLPNDLARRGDVPQVGLVRRTLVIGDRLYSVSDKTVVALDVSNRDVPRVTVTVTVGDINAVETPVPVLIPAPTVVDVGRVSGCALVAPAASSSPPGAAALLGLLLVALALRTGRAPR